MDTTHANELDRSILVKWANPHAVHMLLMRSLIKEVSFSWLAFQGASQLSSLVQILTGFFKKSSVYFQRKHFIGFYHLITTTSPGWAENSWPGWVKKKKKKS